MIKLTKRAVVHELRVKRLRQDAAVLRKRAEDLLHKRTQVESVSDRWLNPTLTHQLRDANRLEQFGIQAIYEVRRRRLAS